MTKPSIGRIVLLENNGPVDIICGIITAVHDDDGRGRDLVNVRAFEDQNPEPWLLLKVPKKHEPGEREPTPSWSWFWPPGSSAAEAERQSEESEAIPLVSEATALASDQDGGQQTRQVVEVGATET